MANELANATVLMNDSLFRDWIKAAIVYQSRNVITEAESTPNHANRLWLAERAVINPEQYLNLFVNAIAADPEVASLGTVVGTDISQTVILAKMDQIWNAVANLLVAQQPPTG